MNLIISLFLCLTIFSCAARAYQEENVLLILDCSLSMEEEIDGQAKIDIAKNVIHQVLSQIPPSTRVGLRVYGHKRDMLKSFVGIDKCEVSELLVPVGPNNRNRIFQELANLKPVGMTPICYSLQEASYFDFVNLPGKKRIILVSDGMETCSGNPCEVAVELVRQNADIAIDVIGFDLSADPSVTSNLKCVALATRGKFYSADSPEDFLRSMQESFRVSKDVQGRVIIK